MIMVYQWKYPQLIVLVQNKLHFISDELYGAPIDPQYPERAYIAPASIVTWTNGEENGEQQPVTGAPYKMKFKLPEGIYGDTVLLQWYYLTANSCKHEGYSEYNFPNNWVGVFDESLPDCGEIPPDGNGVPEQVRGIVLVCCLCFVAAHLMLIWFIPPTASSLVTSSSFIFSFGTVQRFE